LEIRTAVFLWSTVKDGPGTVGTQYPVRLIVTWGFIEPEVSDTGHSRLWPTLGDV